MGNFLSWLQAFASSVSNPLLCRLLTSAQSPHALLHEALPSENGRKVGQISPDSVQYPLEGYKDVTFHYTTAVFTVSPEPRDSSCGADLPGDSALYAISVRRLIALHSGFLRTVPRGSALAFG
jgi:hypothetical protein